MSDSSLAQRQTWLRYFPEGNIEFLLVTRILMVLILLALAAFAASQRAIVLLGLCMVFWVDYALVLWWLVQVSGDTLDLAEGREVSIYDSRRDRRRAGVLVVLPAAAAVLLAAPWPAMAIDRAATREAVVRIALPALGFAYVAMLPLALRVLSRKQVGGLVWRLLLLVPVLHWFALHRVLRTLDGRIRSLRQRSGSNGEEPESSLVAIPLADVTWFLAVVPWSYVLVRSMLDQQWSRLLAPCGAALVAVFAIADVAALEGVQRQFHHLLRRINIGQAR